MIQRIIQSDPAQNNIGFINGAPIKNIRTNLFFFIETSHVGATAGGGIEDEDARTKYRDATADGSFVSGKRTSDERNSNFKRYYKGRNCFGIFEC